MKMEIKKTQLNSTFFMSHPAKNCFPISISLNLNTIWRSNSYFVSIFLFLLKVQCFPNGDLKFLAGKGTILLAFTKPLRLRNVNKSKLLLQLIFWYFVFHSMSFISNSKQVFERKNINKNESNRLWICKFWSKSKRWALGIPRIQVSLTQFDKISVNFYLDPYNLWGFIF